MFMTIVYVASPLAGDVSNNIEKARKYCRMVSDKGFLPLAPHTIFTQFLNDGIEKERNLGMRMGLRLLKRCDELWVFGNDITAGMKAEITVANEYKLPIRWFDETGEEIVSCKD
jgi:hypothetical protein